MVSPELPTEMFDPIQWWNIWDSAKTDDKVIDNSRVLKLKEEQVKTR